VLLIAGRIKILIVDDGYDSFPVCGLDLVGDIVCRGVEIVTFGM